MSWVLYVVSIAWIAFGSLFILYTEQSQQQVRSLFGANRCRMCAAGCAAVFGFLILIAAKSTTHSWIVACLGLAGLAKGALIYFNPNDIYEKSMDWFVNRASAQAFRLWGIVALILGTALFSWIG